MKLLVFAASSSSASINKRLAIYAGSLLDAAKVTVEVLDLNDYQLPLFSQDQEALIGQPQTAKDFLAKIGRQDALIISFAEHNGSYTAAYKNLFDWCSRITRNIYQDKPILLLSTSPGARGAKQVLAMSLETIPRFGGIVKGKFSLPSFHENFNGTHITNPELLAELKSAVSSLQQSV